MSFTLHVENLEALDRLSARFRRLINPDATPLMVTWQKVIEDDNRKGVLAGLDKDGNPLAPVTYRPLNAPARLTAAQKQGQTGNRRGLFQGLAAPLHGNLTSAEYRRLGGPPLAPRGRYSRVITNLETEFDSAQRGSGRWVAYGYWREVVSVRGDKFLRYHFHGIGRTKRRDLTGVRPEGRERAKRAAVNWMMDMVRSGGGSAGISAA